MPSFFFQAFHYIRYITKSKDEHALHSPFLFGFYTSVVFQKKGLLHPDIELLRAELLRNKDLIKRTDFGVQNKFQPLQKLSAIAKSSLSPASQNSFFSSAASFLHSEYILELGGSLGINALYLAKTNPKSKVVSIEGDPELIKRANSNKRNLGINNLTFLEGEFAHTLPSALALLPKLDFVFFDGNHRLEPTWQYFQQCLEKTHHGTVFVFHDIHWSPGMWNVWKKIIRLNEITLSIDFYHFGMVFFRMNQPKQHFTLKF